MIRRGIFHVVSRFPQHFKLYRGKLDYFYNSAGGLEMQFHSRRTNHAKTKRYKNALIQIKVTLFHKKILLLYVVTYLTNFEKKFVKLDFRNPGRFAFSTLLHENENKMGANFFPRKTKKYFVLPLKAQLLQWLKTLQFLFLNIW